MAAWGDDGEPLIDEDGDYLIPYDSDQEYDEPEARELMSFAVTYRQVRGALQATRAGRGQKKFQKIVMRFVLWFN